MLFFTFFLFWVSIQFGEVVEDFLAYIMVISVGILHGANDLLILSTKEQKDKKLIKNLLIYIGIIILCVVIYLFIYRMCRDQQQNVRNTRSRGGGRRGGHDSP